MTKISKYTTLFARFRSAKTTKIHLPCQIKDSCLPILEISSFAQRRKSREASHLHLSREVRGQRNHSSSYCKFDISSLLPRLAKTDTLAQWRILRPTKAGKQHSRFVRDSFAQRRLNFLSWNNSKTSPVHDLAYQKCVLNRVGTVSQTLITRCSKKRTNT